MNVKFDSISGIDEEVVGVLVANVPHVIISDFLYYIPSK